MISDQLHSDLQVWKTSTLVYTALHKAYWLSCCSLNLTAAALRRTGWATIKNYKINWMIPLLRNTVSITSSGAPFLRSTTIVHRGVVFKKLWVVCHWIISCVVEQLWTSIRHQDKISLVLKEITPHLSCLLVLGCLFFTLVTCETRYLMVCLRASDIKFTLN